MRKWNECFIFENIFQFDKRYYLKDTNMYFVVGFHNSVMFVFSGDPNRIVLAFRPVSVDGTDPKYPDLLAFKCHLL